jgi:hypothetical protein
MWINGLPDGIGIRKWPNGDIYQGGFGNGQLNGRGNYMWAGGSTCSANFKDGSVDLLCCNMI